MKKLLLTLVPALMLLGSCAGAQPQVQNGLFHEDTLAHEEIFGSIQDGLKKVRKNAINPGYPDVPTIGVQTKEADGNISLRFIAAVKLTDLGSASAVWTRRMYDDSGDIFAVNGQETAVIECTKAYTSVYSNGAEYDMSAFDEEQGFSSSEHSGYTHFLAYTILNIPKATYKDYFLNAYLTLNGNETDLLATTIDQSKQYLFPADQTGYFLDGTIGTVDEDETKKGEDPTLYNSTFSVDLEAGDCFTILYNSPSKFEVCIPELDGDRSTEALSINASGLITVQTGVDNHVGLYLTTTGKLQTVYRYDITFNVTMLESGIDSLYIVGDFNGWNTTANNLDEIDSSKVYTTIIRLDEGSRSFKFYNESYEFDCSNRRINVSSAVPSYDFVYGEPDYYLVGVIKGVNKWSTVSDDRRLTQIGSTGVFSINADFDVNDAFQVVRVEKDGSWEWHGTGTYHNENYVVPSDKDGNYTVYFGNNYEGIDVTPSFYIKGTYNNWEDLDENYRLTVDPNDRNHYTFKGLDSRNSYNEYGSNIGVISTTRDWYGNESGGDTWLPNGTYDIDFYVSVGSGVSHINYTKVD